MGDLKTVRVEPNVRVVQITFSSSNPREILFHPTQAATQTPFRSAAYPRLGSVNQRNDILCVQLYMYCEGGGSYDTSGTAKRAEPLSSLMRLLLRPSRIDEHLLLNLAGMLSWFSPHHMLRVASTPHVPVEKISMFG